jgi:hypothetical protein
MSNVYWKRTETVIQQDYEVDSEKCLKRKGSADKHATFYFIIHFLYLLLFFGFKTFSYSKEFYPLLQARRCYYFRMCMRFLMKEVHWGKYTEYHTDVTSASSASYAWQLYIYIYIYAFDMGLALAQIMIFPKNWLDDLRVVTTLEFNVS